MSDLRKLQVLIVDDETEIKIALSRYLSAHGCDVSEAETPGVACDEWNRGLRPDVIVTDYRMPGMNGVELVDWFRAQGSTAGAVLISGNLGDLPQAAYGSLTVLQKPFRTAELLQAVRRLA